MRWDASCVVKRHRSAGMISSNNFPKTDRILDFFHASEHVGQMAQAVCAGDLADAAQQTTDWCHLLKHSGGTVLRTQWEQLNTSDWSDVRREVYRQELQ